MIHSFANSRTQRLAEGIFGVLPTDIDRMAQKRLRLLEAATSVKDLRHLPSIDFQAEKPSYSIHVAGAWRIRFLWPKGSRGPRAVDISDRP